MANQMSRGPSRSVKYNGSASSKSRCTKHPGHKEFIPIRELSINHLPSSFQSHDVVDCIKLKANETVKLAVSATSPNRPENIAVVRATSAPRFGSGTAFMFKLKEQMPCPFPNCQEAQGPHNVTGYFKVMTAAHIVFSDEEARSTTVEFFFDNDNNTSSVVTARGVRMSSVDVEQNRSVFECVSHNLNLWKTLQHFRDERDRLQQGLSQQHWSDDNMVVMISHPHGMAKQVTIGSLLDIQRIGKVTKLGSTSLDGCFLTYTTPSCPGSGGGSVTVYGKGVFNLAFGPHCSTEKQNFNKSGLGWTVVI